MKVMTWNINGIRAMKMSTKQMLESLDADIVCLQETKVTRDMIDEPTAIVDGYEAYLSFSRKRTGYSGTANYCRNKASPWKAEEGLTGCLAGNDESVVGCHGDVSDYSDEELEALDAEGHCVITQHRVRVSSGEKNLAVINVYVPRAGDREDRHQYKLKFLSLLQCRAEALLKEGINVIILGDINTTHCKLDNCEADIEVEYQRQSSRVWLNQLLQECERDPGIPLKDETYSDLSLPQLKGGLFSDVFRRLHPGEENAFTNWCTMTGARQTNYGRRLDYIFVDTQLAEFVTSCDILADVEGSDHCPVVVTLNCQPLPSSLCPQLCTKFMPEFKGQQQKLSAFFTKSSRQGCLNSKGENQVLRSDPDSPIIQREQSQKPKEKTSPEKGPLKRGGSDLKGMNTKKPRLKQSDSGPRQISLITFFGKADNPKTNSQASSQSEAKKDQNALDTNLKNTPLTSSAGGIFAESVSEDTKSTDTVSPSNGSNSSDIDNTLNEKDSNHSTKVSSSQKGSRSSMQAWKSLLSGLPPPPLCKGHNEPCILRTVKKVGPNKNKQFYVCSHPDGAPGNPLSRCDFFQWLNDKKKKV